MPSPVTMATSRPTARKAAPRSKKATAGKPSPKRAVSRARKNVAKASAPKGKAKAAPARKAAKKEAPLEFIEVRSPTPPQAAEPLNIALFGASGDIGSRIAEEALARGHRVTALVRNPAQMSGEHPNLRIVRGDATDPLQVAVVARNHDVVGSAISPPMQDLQVITYAAKALLAASRETSTRVVAVGGAGSLKTANGKALLATKEFPKEWLPVASAHRDALDAFQAQGEGVAWTVISPSAFIEPGKRTGKFRLGNDNLLVDGKGISRISMEDYAVAFVDELESGANAGKRITVGY